MQRIILTSVTDYESLVLQAMNELKAKKTLRIYRRVRRIFFKVTGEKPPDKSPSVKSPPVKI